MDIVLVEWLDAQEETGALTAEGCNQQVPATSRTVGMLRKKNKNEIVLSATQHFPGEQGEHYKATWTIPMGCVKKIKKLGKV